MIRMILKKMNDRMERTIRLNQIYGLYRSANAVRFFLDMENNKNAFGFNSDPATKSDLNCFKAYITDCVFQLQIHAALSEQDTKKIMKMTKALAAAYQPFVQGSAAFQAKFGISQRQFKPFEQQFGIVGGANSLTDAQWDVLIEWTQV